MDRFEKTLVAVLRLTGFVMLTAIVPAVMPFAWMDDIHRLLGMGDLPNAPIVNYLTRSLSAMYAMHGALLMFFSIDVRRYVTAVKFMAALAVLFGAGILAIDIIAGMPPAWTIGEGPFVIVLGGLLLWLSSRIGIEGVKS